MALGSTVFFTSALPCSVKIRIRPVEPLPRTALLEAIIILLFITHVDELTTDEPHVSTTFFRNEFLLSWHCADSTDVSNAFQSVGNGALSLPLRAVCIPKRTCTLVK